MTSRALTCCCCGSSVISSQRVLWEALINEWNLGAHEVAYIERQQGVKCDSCGNNLRSMALAAAVMRVFGYAGLFKDFVKKDSSRELRIAELNSAGLLTQFLEALPGHVLKTYPNFDMMQLEDADESFDLVLHSDTLEHIEHPVRGLSECRRVLKQGGVCAYTIPMVVERLTRSRRGLPPSYHGSSDNPDDCLVWTEYGADAWTQPLQAGFKECRITSLEFPAAQALVAIR